MTPPPELHSPLADIEFAFRFATRPPALLTLDGAVVGPDLPRRPIPLDELRRLLLHGSTSYATKDRALGLVASRAHTGDDLWTVGFAGLLMPGLKRVARRLRQAPYVDPAEVGPEVVAALMEAIADIDPNGERLAARVCWEVYRRSARALGVRRPDAREIGWRPPMTLPGSAVPSTNPEEAIARAVRAGVITPDDAELIALTRLEGTRVTDLAASLALPPDRLQKRRVRAEARLAALLRLERAGEISCSPPWGGGHRASSPSTATTSHRRYCSRPGARLAGIRLSPSDMAHWSAAAAAPPSPAPRPRSAAA
jgi:hypothetical protein